MSIRSQQFGSLSDKEIESTRRVIRRKIRRTGELFTHAYGYLPLFKKPSEVRMGKGKGNKLRCKVFPVRPGQILFSLRKVSLTLALQALKAGLKKLSISGYVTHK
jgi:large subunit ribosomal protein L16